MLKLTFNRAAKLCYASMMAGNTPMVFGHAGIGKSQLAAYIAEAMTADNVPTKLEIIYGSILGEKELGGIPIRTKKTLVGRNGEPSIEVPVNEYTIHNKVLDILNNAREGYSTVLFIDELNRCDRAVQCELMQLVLDRRINDIKLPKNCYVICAGNLESDDVADYQVSVLNDALKDRFCQIELTPNLSEWLRWGLLDNPKTKESNIDSDVIDYLTEYQESFFITTGEADIKPNPRSWEMVSKGIRAIRKNYDENALEYDPLHSNDNTIYYLAAGHVGDIIGNEFFNFLKNKRNPLIKPEEFINANKNDFEVLLKKLRGESIPRMTVEITRLVKKLSEILEESPKSLTAAIKERFITILESLPKDFMVGELQDIGNNYKKLHNTMSKMDPYVDLYIDTLKRVKEMS